MYKHQVLINSGRNDPSKMYDRTFKDLSGIRQREREEENTEKERVNYCTCL